MALGDKKVAKRSLRLANQRMQKEVLPLLSTRYPRPRNWNPLRSEFRVSTPYGLKLWGNDKGAMEILRNKQLVDQTAQIALEATIEGIMAEPEAFVTNVLDHLMNDHG